MKIQKQFTEIITLIRQARFEAFKLVNTTLIDLYWNIVLHQSENRKRRMGEINGATISWLHTKAGARPQGIF